MQRLALAVAVLVATLGLPVPGAVADDELNVSSSTNGVVLNDPDKNFDNVKVELRSFGNEFRYVIHQRVSPGGLDAGTGCRGETKEAGDQATISCVRLFPKVTANLGNRSLTRAATNRFEVPPTFPDPISYTGGFD